MRLSLLSLMCGLLALTITACDSTGPDGDSVDFTAADGRTVEVHFRDGARPLMTFASVDEYVAHLGELEAASTVTVDRALWDRLGSAHGPFVVSMLDGTGSVDVGDSRYTAEPTSVVSRPLADLRAAPKLEVYYGADGTAEVEEYNRVMELSSMPQELARVQFQNPHVQALADRIIASGGVGVGEYQDGGDSATEATVAARWGTEFRYSPTTTVRLLDGSQWSVRVQGYNQDGGSWWQGYWAAGNTQTQVYDAANGGWGAPGFGNRPSIINSYVDIKLKLRRDTNAYTTLQCTTGRDGVDEPDVPYTYIKSCYSLNANDSRATGFDPTSEHEYVIHTYEYDYGYLYNTHRIARAGTIVIP